MTWLNPFSQPFMDINKSKRLSYFNSLEEYINALRTKSISEVISISSSLEILHQPKVSSLSALINLCQDPSTPTVKQLQLLVLLPVSLEMKVEMWVLKQEHSCLPIMASVVLISSIKWRTKIRWLSTWQCNNKLFQLLKQVFMLP